jgi:galactokinase
VADLKIRVLTAFDAHFGGTPQLLARAPGRVNLIGEHTDYNDGFVLPMAISGETMVAARRRDDGMVRLLAVDFDGARSAFSIAAPIVPDAAAPWSNYIRGVAHALLSDGVALSGADIVIAGSVPRGAGLSSSASLELAVGLALAALAGVPDHDRTRLARAGQRAEHEFAGCKCGIMDQMVSAHGLEGHAVLLDCRSLVIESVALPENASVMIVHSGIERGLVDGEYNSRRQQCEMAARHYGVAALRDLEEAQLVAGRQGLDPLAFSRARHVVTENARTLAAADVLRSGDLAALGRLMAASHASMRDDFEITVPAIDQLVAILQSAIGEHGGARMTGGGFGGAVVAIMPTAAVGAVRTMMETHYRMPDGAPPIVMIETASPGASLISF